MRRSMDDLDKALQWPDGTSWSLVSEDRSQWSREILEDEERGLLERRDEADHFAFVVAARLRAIPAGVERDDVMRRILAALGIEP
jgi:hypothetical protein